MWTQTWNFLLQSQFPVMNPLYFLFYVSLWTCSPRYMRCGQSADHHILYLLHHFYYFLCIAVRLYTRLINHVSMVLHVLTIHISLVILVCSINELEKRLVKPPMCAKQMCRLCYYTYTA